MRSVLQCSGQPPVEGKPLSCQSTSPSVGGTVPPRGKEEWAAERTMKSTEVGSAFLLGQGGGRRNLLWRLQGRDRRMGGTQTEPAALAVVVDPIHLANLAAAGRRRPAGRRKVAVQSAATESYRIILSRLARPGAGRRFGLRVTINTWHSPLLSRSALPDYLSAYGLDTPPLRALSIAGRAATFVEG